MKLLVKKVRKLEKILRRLDRETKKLARKVNKHLSVDKLLISLVLMMLVGSSGAFAEPSEIVLKTIAMESAGESFEGQVMVARVIINRSRASGASLEAVCKAKRQFSCWNSQKWAKRWLNRHFGSRTRLTALAALKQARIANSRYTKIFHYHTRQVMPRWSWYKMPLIRIGDTLFYEGIR